MEEMRKILNFMIVLPTWGALFWGIYGYNPHPRMHLMFLIPSTKGTKYQRLNMDFGC